MLRRESSFGSCIKTLEKAFKIFEGEHDRH
jgi:hypothetical protein